MGGGVEEGGGWKKVERMATTTATLRSGGAQPDTQFTCFTGTKVQILTLRTCAMLRMDEDSTASGEVLRSKAQRCRQQHFEAVSYVALAFRYRDVQVEVCRCRRGYRGRGRGSVGRQWRVGGKRESDWRRHALAALRVSVFVLFFFTSKVCKLSTWECCGVTFMTASKCCQHAGACPAHRPPTATAPPAMPRRVTHAKEGEKEDPSVSPPSFPMPPPHPPGSPIPPPPMLR